MAGPFGKELFKAEKVSNREEEVRDRKKKEWTSGSYLLLMSVYSNQETESLSTRGLQSS